MFFGYIDFTNDGLAFYVGIGNLQRTRQIARNSKHKGIRSNYGHYRETWFSNVDWDVMKQWEITSIAKWKTFHYDRPNGIGCNFTRGGDGTLGWQPSPETRAKWSIQRVGNTNSRRLSKRQPRVLKGFSEEARFKQGATNRGKHLSEEHRKKIGKSSKGRKLSEETRAKMRKPRTPEQKERYKQAALKRWERKQNEQQHNEKIVEISKDTSS